LEALTPLVLVALTVPVTEIEALPETEAEEDGLGDSLADGLREELWEAESGFECVLVSVAEAEVVALTEEEAEPLELVLVEAEVVLVEEVDGLGGGV